MRRTEPWLRRCRLAAAACLALPLLCFAVWDAVLCHAAPFAPDTAGALSAAGRADPTACLLYGCTHSLSLPLQGGADGWAQDPAPRSELAAGLLAQLEPLRQAGVLDDALYAAVDAAARAESSVLRRDPVPAGLTQYTLQSAGTAPALWLGAVFTPQGVPVYLTLQNGPDAPPPTLDALLDAAGLAHFDDWQPQTLAGYAGQTGETRYSAAAQLYARVSYDQGFTFRLVSMTPGELQTFTAAPTT